MFGFRRAKIALSKGNNRHETDTTHPVAKQQGVVVKLPVENRSGAYVVPTETNGLKDIVEMKSLGYFIAVSGNTTNLSQRTDPINLYQKRTSQV